MLQFFLERQTYNISSTKVYSIQSDILNRRLVVNKAALANL